MRGSAGGESADRGPVLGAYLAAVARHAGRHLVVGVALVLFGGITEGLGVTVLIGLLGTAGVEGGEGNVGDLQRAVDTALRTIGIQPTLESALVAFAVVAVLRAVVIRAQSVVGAAIQQRVVLALRSALFDAVARASWVFVTRTRTSDVTHALTTDIDRVNAGTAQVTVLAGAVSIALAYAALGFLIAPIITLVVVVGSLLVLVATRGGTRSVAASGGAISAAGRAVHRQLYELFGAMRLIKTHGLQDAASREFTAAVTEHVERQSAATRHVANAKLWLDLASTAVLVVATYVGLTALGLTAVELALALVIFFRVAPRIAQAQQAYHVIVAMLPSYANVAALTRAAEAAAESVEADSRGAWPKLERGIALEGVGFSYAPTEIATDTPDAVLTDVTMEIPARRITAIVGPSGSGKSTIADLLLGLVLPDRGRVTVDGVALQAASLASWRASTGYVPQETVLLNDTIRANLAWGANGATTAEIEGALRAARAEAFVDRLPAGLDTVVGDRGVRLSGGERQRLAIARALLRRPVMLVLDEATSELDEPTERQVLADVARLRASTTIVIITHGRAAVEIADVVHAIDGGRVVDSAAPDGLPGSMLAAEAAG